MRPALVGRSPLPLRWHQRWKRVTSSAAKTFASQLRA
jgi:hypothetical protein